MPEIDTATFVNHMYNDFLQAGYAVYYYMNFSRTNNNYDTRERIWNQLLMNLNFVFINEAISHDPDFQ